MNNKHNGRSLKQTAPKNDIDKGRHYCTPLQEIRRLFLTGLHFYAKQLNAWAGSKDSRKCIYTLRKQGMNIKDLWYNRKYPNAPHIKIYWLEMDSVNCSQSLSSPVNDNLSVCGKESRQMASSEPQRLDSIIANKWQPIFKGNLTLGREVNHEE